MMDAKKDELIKAAIIEAARRVFQKWGLKKSTMEDIAEEAGKGKSTLYYYFKSKRKYSTSSSGARPIEFWPTPRPRSNMSPKTKEKLKNILSPH